MALSISTAPRAPSHRTPSLKKRTLYSTVIATPLPLPRLGILCEHGHITHVRFLPATTALQAVAVDNPDAVLISRLLDMVADYFHHPETSFSVPLLAAGTPFQLRVWRAISAIPSGETRCYGDLARELETSPRAIGGACRANPLPLLVPCHRVIAADGGNGGFMGHAPGQGMSASVKAWLLQHERN